MKILRSLGLAFSISVLSCGLGWAQERAEGPAQKPVEAWFKATHRKAVIERWQVFYDKNGAYAVAVADYSTPDGGNSFNVAVGVFRKETDGSYVFVKQAKPSDGKYGETDGVTFQPGAAIVSSSVLKPGDPRCCPTGKKTWKIDLP